MAFPLQVRALPKLRILVMGLLKSMKSIAYIGVLLLLLFYIYAVLGVSLFQKVCIFFRSAAFRALHRSTASSE